MADCPDYATRICSNPPRPAPRQRFTDDATTDPAPLAATCGFGLARNHPYRDGSKRVAFVAMAVFLGLNGLEVSATEAEVVTTMVALAAGTLDEETLADWIRQYTRKRRTAPLGPKPRGDGTATRLARRCRP